jgi:3-methyladenine DNA glycosylase AlkD
MTYALDMTTWSRKVVIASQRALENIGDPEHAEGAAKYMKYVAPFFGITAPERRQALKAAWSHLPPPTSDDLGKAAKALMALDEREYHYAAYDLIEKYIDYADDYFLAEHLEPLLTTKPWWDTVDGLVSAGVSPLCFRFDATKIVNEWSRSENRWLIRAAIGHQRGWKRNTNVPYVLDICDQHWADKEFFIAKAIGWALRDITAFNPTAVDQFLRSHPTRNSVAEREAKRGLLRVSR